MLHWEQNGPGNAEAEERTTVDVYPDSPTKDPTPSLPEMEVRLMVTRGRYSEGPREFVLPRGTLCLGTLWRTK